MNNKVRECGCPEAPFKYCKATGYNSHHEKVSYIGPPYDGFEGEEEDEKIAGRLYNRLPRFPFLNQVNRHEAVRVLADELRKIKEEWEENIEDIDD